MYILNNNKLRKRPAWVTWLFFNKQLSRDIKESIPILKEDISRLGLAEHKVHAANMLSLEFSIAELGYGMTELLDHISGINHGWIRYSDIRYLLVLFKILDMTLKEIEFKKGVSNV